MALFGPPNIEKLKARGNIKGLIHVWMNNKNDTIRCQAAEALGQIGDERAVEPLISGLRGRNSVCLAAAKALGQIGDAAVKPLTAFIVKYTFDPHEAQAAAEAVKQIGNTALEALIAVLKNWNDWRSPDAIIKVLGHIGDDAVEPLIEMLDDKNIDWKVKSEVIYLLGEIGNRLAVETLIDILISDGYWRRSAADALDKTGWSPSQDETGVAYWIAKGKWNKCIEIGVSSIELLIAELKDCNQSMYLEIISALRTLGVDKEKINLALLARIDYQSERLEKLIDELSTTSAIESETVEFRTDYSYMGSGDQHEIEVREIVRNPRYDELENEIRNLKIHIEHLKSLHSDMSLKRNLEPPNTGST